MDAYNDYKKDFITSLMRQGLNRQQAQQAWDDYEEQEVQEHQEMIAGTARELLN